MEDRNGEYSREAATEQEAAVARGWFLAAAALDNARVHGENRCERLEEGFVRERDRAAVAELVLADRGAQLREEQAMVSEFQDTALGMQAQVDEFVEQYAESTKRVIDQECSDAKKHERDLVENAEGLAMSSGPHGQTSAAAHEFSSANMSNEVCHNSCSLPKIYTVGQQFVDREGGVFCVKKKWKIVTTRPMLTEVMAPYARISRAPGPCRLQALRWEGLRSSALSGFSSECRDPATTAAVDDLTVLRTPREEWKFCGNSLPFSGGLA